MRYLYIDKNNNVLRCYNLTHSAREKKYEIVFSLTLQHYRQMTKRQLYISALVVLSFSAAFLFSYFTQKSVNPEQFIALIESNLQEQERAVDAILSDQDFIAHYIQASKEKTSFLETDLGRLKEIAKHPYSLFFYHKNNLVAWTNNHVSIEPEIRNNIGHNGEKSLIDLGNGHYEVFKKNYSFPTLDSVEVIAVLPIKHDYILESDYLNNDFVASENLAKGIDISLTPTDYPIKNIDGATLCHLDIKGEITDKNSQLSLLLLYLIAFIFLGTLVNDVAKKIAADYRPWAGAAFLIIAVFGFRYFSITGDFTSAFSDLDLFARTFDTPVLNSSLGDLLINIVLLLWMMVFFHQEFQVKSFVHLSTPIRYFLTSLNYFSIMLGVLMITSVFKSLVMDSGITFDFDNVFNLNFYSFLSIVGVLLLLFALFLFTHRMVHTINQIGLERMSRMACLVLAAVAIIPVTGYTELFIPAAWLVGMSVIYIWLFDAFISSRGPTLSWLVGWLVIFAAYSSVLLYKYNTDKDILIQSQYATDLAVWQDSLAEEGLDSLRRSLLTDKKLEQYVKTPYPAMDSFDIEEKLFHRSLDKHFTKNHYLFNNYVYHYWCFSQKNKASIIKNRGDVKVKDAIKWLNRLEENGRKTQYEDLKYIINDTTNTLHYLLPLVYNKNSGDERILLLEFSRRQREASKVYTELLLDVQYKKLEHLPKYHYAIYRKGKLIEQKGKSYDITLPENFEPPAENRGNIFFGTQSEVIYEAPNDVVVMIGRDMGGMLKLISLFSYLFVLLIFTVVTLAGINYFVKVLPKPLQFDLFRKPSLRNTIQLWVIGLIITSFIAIGVVTVIYFQSSSNRYHEKRLERKVRSVLTHATMQQELDCPDPNDCPEPTDIEKMIMPFSAIHRMDINVFDKNGLLIGSSEDDIFKKEIIAPRMNPIALYALANENNAQSIQEEHIGKLEYKSAYVPLFSQSKELIAYIGLPYYSKQRELRSDVYDFMGTLLNVYVFLLLVAGVIAIFVANSITRPLSKIGDRIRQFQLEGANEPLEWKRSDELGVLIEEYNNMIEKVKDSTQQLKESEREVAWREMAKQVAHEIKNPLTPMKLSIQYLMHAYHSKTNIEPLLKRVSSTLIEQIDGLARIATEFSSFAKMPKASNANLNLNDLVASVYDLFNQNELENLELNLFLPDSQYIVHADKDQLVRVFNNLIKNAIQAVPDERLGKIDVSIFDREGMAIVRVSDNGTGISEEMREKVFYPNFTTKSSGTGLGLAMSKNIVDQAKGRIYFNTMMGQGTDFYVELPIVEVEEAVM